MHRVRRLHGRVPVRRQEHPRPQLPLPRREGRGGGVPGPQAVDVERSATGSGSRPNARGPCFGSGAAPSRPPTWCSPQGPSAPPASSSACSMREGSPGSPTSSGYLVRTNSESILGAVARDTSVDYSQGCRHHLVDRDQQPHEDGTRPLPGGEQFDGPAGLDPRQGRRPAAAVGAIPGCGPPPPDPVRQITLRMAMGRASRHPAGHAEPRQQPASHHGRGALRAADQVAARPRRTQPHLATRRP